MSDLARELARLIRSDGPISVARYMELALNHPRYGYYAGRDPLGADGDFTTAPEISQAFGELIGLWCAFVWASAIRPARARLVELGPGRGTMMADALRAMARVAPEALEAFDVHLVETSPALTALQQEALAGTGAEWHTRLADVPAGPLLLVANEFFDALPVHQYQRTGKGWRARLVAHDQGTRFCFVMSRRVAIPPLPPEVLAAPAGSVGEMCPAGLALAREIGQRLARDGGAALIVDYGHARSAPGETLQAVKGHQRHDPLHDPGEADLTAHVDFAALAHAAEDAGARAYGPRPQGPFLADLGLSARQATLLAKATPQQAKAIRSGVRRLIDPNEMGTLFKALALAHPALPTPPGFDSQA